jgi:hypothetical protein
MDATHHRLAHRLPFTVETNDKSAIYEETRAKELMDALGYISANILIFIACTQGFIVRRLDAHEYREKVGFFHEPEQFRIVGQVYARLGRKLERVAALSRPRCKLLQERLDGGAITYEVVVDHIDMSAIAERIQGIEFRNDLFGGLDSWDSAVELDDIAKLTTKRTSA